ALVGPSGSNPELLLAMSGIASERGENLTPEKDVEILYLDGAGDRQRFIGLASSFDPSVASRVLCLRWKNSTTGQYEEWVVPSGANPENLIARWRTQIREARAEAAAASAL
ncbi:MAG: hypothetical protein AAGG01_18065, partial [Planctomycetota bacterium]